MANGYIGQVRIGSNDYKIGSTLYAVCSSTGQNRTVVIDGFAISTGVTVHIKFEHEYTDTANAPKLIIKSSADDATAAAIEIINANGPKTWGDNSVIALTLTGTSVDNYKWAINSSAIDGSSIQNLSLGQITSAGKITGKASQAVVTNASEEITAIDLTVPAPDANGNSLAFIDTISQNSQGQITATKKTVQNASRTQAGVIKLPDGNTTTKFLREDGSWEVPPDTHHQASLITGASNTAQTTAAGGTNKFFLNLIENNEVRSSHEIVGSGSVTVGSDASGKITITGTKSGTVTSITPGNGLINGTSGNSQSAITDSGTISIKEGGVTNAMLAGSIVPSKLDDTATIGIGTQSIKVGSSFDTTQLLKDLALSSAMHYKGEVTAIPPTGTYNSGDVVILKDTAKEYVYDGTNWRELGSESSYKKIQTAVSDPTVPTSGTTTSNSFIATITQNTEGVITVTKRNVPVTSVAGKTGAVTLDHADVGLDQVSNHAQVTSITWSNNTLKQSISGGTATDIVTASTLKSAMSLNNVTNDAQIAKSIGTTKGDIIYFDGASSPKNLGIGTAGYVLTVSNSGIPAWEENASTDENVKQTPDSTSTDSFPILFSSTKTTISNTTTTTTKVNNSIYIVPKTGELHASKFYGDGANITGITTSQIAGTVNGGTKYLRQDGWKTVSVSLTNSTSTSNTVVTSVGFNQGTFPSLGTSGKAAQFEVNNGILIITAGSDATLSSGTLPSLGTIGRATLGITGN